MFYKAERVNVYQQKQWSSFLQRKKLSLDRKLNKIDIVPEFLGAGHLIVTFMTF